MNSRSRALLLLVLAAFAHSAFARVLSYAPYTNRAAAPAFQSRTAGEFVLVEQPGTQFMASWIQDGEVVVYDAHSVREPRVIFPPSGMAPSNVYFAAYVAAPPGSLLPARVLVQTDANFEGKNATRHVITLLGDTTGTSWKQVPELNGAMTSVREYEDVGGYFTRGLDAQVRVRQSGKYPFVLETNVGIWGVDASGHAKKLVIDGPYMALVIGGDLAGTRVLVQQGGRIAVLDVASEVLTDVGPADAGGWRNQGWITSDGRAYVMTSRQDGRYLALFRQGSAPQRIEGPSVLPGFPPPVYREQSSFFAAPTHDYNGAWMIQRDTGRPTTLLRHMNTTTTEMWRDITGPQVEALHPGASGERLLVQVHRPRVQPERWFIDPALAVWEIGAAAPRDYHELFLNETSRKGFVHLDVDAAAEGEQFIFDSGLSDVPNSRVSPPISGGGDVVQEWGVVRSAFKQELVLPGVARLPGAFNTYWQTDVVIYNPLAEAQRVVLRFAPLDGRPEAAQLQTHALNLAPKEIRVVKDVLHALFGHDAAGGSLHIEPAVGVSATGRTYTKAGQGTYGFSMIAIDAFTAAGTRFPLSFAGAFPGRNFRTNILLTAPKGLTAGARLQAYGVSGEIGTSGVTLDTLDSGVWQMNNVNSVLSLATHEEGGLVVRPTRGFIIPAVVAIDNLTNDPTYFPPDLPAPLVRTIPVVGHIDGANGSKFRSDIYLLNLSTSAQTVTLEAKAWDTPGASKQVSFTLLPSEDRVIADVLPRLFNMSGLARLRYSSSGFDGEGVRVTSRTYNLLENGGTLGCLIPPLNSFQSAASGESLEILGVTGGGDYRANIGLVELSPVFSAPGATNIRIEIINELGVMIDSFQVALPNAGGMQINNIFQERGLTPPKAALIRIKPSGPGLIGAYATLTDNVTNDPSFLAATLGAQE